MNWSKSMNIEDYMYMGHTTILIDSMIDDHVPHMPLHLHRRWEYGMAIGYLQANKVKTVVDVGGAGSLFAPLAAFFGFDVTVVDPLFTVKMAEIQGQYMGLNIKSMQGTDIPEADAVVALSTIEHVEDDKAFLEEMKAKGKVVFLTTDYSLDGRVYNEDQLRTYTASGLNEMAPDGDYAHFKPYVLGYSFASIAA